MFHLISFHFPNGMYSQEHFLFYYIITKPLLQQKKYPSTLKTLFSGKSTHFTPPGSLFPGFLGWVFRNLPAYFKNSSVSTFWYPPKLVGQAKMSSAISFPRNSFVISFSFSVMSTSAKSSGYTVFAMYQVLARTIS